MSETFRDDGTERDAGLAALYRAAAREEPPPVIDDAVRAAARRAVASRPRIAGLPLSRSWRVPLSIAAVMLLSVSLVTVMREEAPESDSVGLKTPAQTRSSGISLRDDRVSPGPALEAGARKDMAAAEVVTSTPVPATVPALAAGAIQPRAELPPDQWLERIEELRRQGKLEEAKTSLAEFRKRYPDYELPVSLKDWEKP